ncbi:MAG: hypothetical protein ACRDRN_21845 [Sciscionella sp.]
MGSEVIGSRYVRYAAATTGSDHLVADITLPDVATLHTFVTGSA